MKHLWNPRALRTTLLLLIVMGVIMAPGRQPATAATGRSIFGVAITANQVNRNNFASKAQAANVDWVRYGGPQWSDVEPTSPVKNPNGSWTHTYDSSKFAVFDAELQSLHERGLTAIVMIQGTPLWAVDPDAESDGPSDGGKRCLPIAEQHLVHFAAYLKYVVGRYKAAPYNVRNWEIWNEPDAPRQAFVGNSTYSGFGCWGDKDDQDYFGGEAFGRMLKVVYPAIKQVDPGATVYHGGLMLSADSSDRSGGGHGPNGTGRFFKGVLNAMRSGRQYAFDHVNFHSYAYWYATPDDHIKDWSLYLFGAAPNEQSLPKKVEYLRAQLRAHGIVRPISVNEGALLAPDNTSIPSKFLDQQANYVIRYYVRAWAHRLAGVAWYALNDTGWRQSGLYTGLTPRPGNTALTFLARELSGSSYRRHLANNPAGLEGYKFGPGAATTAGYRYRVYWTNDSAVRTTVSKPPSRSVTVYDKFGTDMTASWLSGDRISVGFEPVIIKYSWDQRLGADD